MPADYPVTCGDLANLGAPWDSMRSHHPERQGPDDPHCRCWREAHASDFVSDGHAPPDLPAHLLEQECHRLHVVDLDENHQLRMCCWCFEEIYGQVIARLPVHEIPAWLLVQAKEALAWRDRNRLDPSPVAADMDVQAAAVEEGR